MRRFLPVFLTVFALGGTAGSAGDGATLEPGQKAPPFSLPGSDGKTYSLEDLRGKTVVIAWFPKAFTGG
jgi:peroxiredoxin